MSSFLFQNLSTGAKSDESEVKVSTSSSPRFKTLSPEDHEFSAYLDGSFSATELALPVRSLNVGSVAEEITFEIFTQSEIPRPSFVQILWTLVRPSSLVFSVGPMLASLFYCYAHSLPVQLWLAVCSFVGVLAFHIALNFFNDFNDHVRGRDRLRPHGGSRAIQRGWIRAYVVRRAGMALIGFAFLAGLPAFFFSPVLIVAGLAGLVGLEFAFQKLRLQARGWAEILAFLLTGPMLTMGFAWAISGTVQWTEVVLGCIFGALSLMYFHSANFENIMPDGQAGVRTWATRTGFDASKTFFYFTAVLTFVTTSLYVFWFEEELRLASVPMIEAVVLLPACVRVKGLASPLSSELVGLRFEAVKLCWLVTAALVAGFVWMI